MEVFGHTNLKDLSRDAHSKCVPANPSDNMGHNLSVVLYRTIRQFVTSLDSL